METLFIKKPQKMKRKSCLKENEKKKRKPCFKKEKKCKKKQSKNHVLTKQNGNPVLKKMETPFFKKPKKRNGNPVY